MDTVLEILKENEILNTTSVSKTQILNFEKRPQGQAEMISLQRIEANSSMNISQQKVAAINQAFEKQSLGVQLTQQLGTGQSMPEYKDFHKVFSEQQCDLVHKKGQVLLVDVWATWCGPCQNPMKHNQQMLEKNQQKWKGKVSIVAVSVDQEKEVTQKRVNDRGWNKIQHLTLLGWKNDHALIQDFKIQGIPFVFLVDKQGKINYIGHPSKINLEERINQLIQKQQPKVQTQAMKQSGQSQSLVLEIRKLQELNKKLSRQSLQQRYGKADLFCINAKTQVKISNGKLQTCTMKLKISTFEDTPQLIEDFKGYIKDVDASIYQIEENLVKFEKVPEVENPQCSDCKNKLSYPFYWCKWDTNSNSFRCRECVEKKPTEGHNHYSYLQNSVFLPRYWQKIAVKSLGNNIQPKDIEQVQFPNQFGCNGCGTCPQEIGIARYICLACRADPKSRGDYIDICEECLNSYFKGDEQKRKTLNVEGHTENHPLLRVIYNVQGYYKF